MLDFDKLKNPDVVHNLNDFPYPFKDNEFDKILAFRILEHLSNPLKVMGEFYRISKHKGRIYISCLYTFDITGKSELEHNNSLFIWNTFGRMVV